MERFMKMEDKRVSSVSTTDGESPNEGNSSIDFLIYYYFRF